jgi:hypothetical protein
MKREVATKHGGRFPIWVMVSNTAARQKEQFDDMRQPEAAGRIIDLVLCLCIAIPVYR